MIDIINNREKFSILALPLVNVDDTISSNAITDNYWVSNELPLIIDNQWVDWVGSLQVKHLHESSLFILTKQHSDKPGVLNEEDKFLHNSIDKFYQGLVISADFFGFPEKHNYYYIGGYKINDEINVRTYEQWEPVYPIKGSPHPIINYKLLCSAATLADNISQLYEINSMLRIKRSIMSFFLGVYNPHTFEKIHQFVRSIEGFIIPEKGKTERQFVDRTKLFVGSGHEEEMRLIYKIRSQIEHLHDPLEVIDIENEREKRLTFFISVFKAEAISRHCIRTFLLNESIWHYFENDEKMNDFWSLPIEERNKIWGNALNLDKISNSFYKAI